MSGLPVTSAVRPRRSKAFLPAWGLGRGVGAMGKGFAGMGRGIKDLFNGHKITSPALKVSDLTGELHDWGVALEVKANELGQREATLTHQAEALNRQTEALSAQSEELALREEALIQKREELLNQREEFSRRKFNTGRLTAEMEILRTKLAQKEQSLTGLQTELRNAKFEIMELKAAQRGSFSLTALKTMKWEDLGIRQKDKETLGLDQVSILELFLPILLGAVKKAYRGASLKFHPDRNHGDHGAMQDVNSACQRVEETIKGIDT